ncbi:CDP-alcohol phosphatidyltransferase family protein [Cardiobacteriaceae bacterium TAE3-ERU3]|nr:CDP-alcohol phosphatidyltransferase family protein [Cardiobacteriaceae bacterium TAE3-ERU3]
MIDHFLITHSERYRQAAARRLQRANVSADMMTWAGFACGAVAVVLIATQHYWLAVVFILLNRIGDSLDGALARLNGVTDKGAFLDITLDFIFYAGVVLGFALADPLHNALPAAVLLFSFFGTGCSFLAFAIMAEKQKLASLDYPNKGFYYLGGLTEGAETIACFVLMCIFPQWFAALAYGYASMCMMTTIVRVTFGVKTL